MALTFEFVEEYKTSRPISMSENSFQQEFVFFICGNFYDEADVDATYGADDDIVALNAAYSIVPPQRSMPLYDGGYILLTLSSLSVEQFGNDIWKISASYAARPVDQSPNTNQPGPQSGDRDQWTNNFVQLSFNVAAQQELKTMSLALVDIKKNTGFGNQNVPYEINKRAPIGHTVDGVEGDQAYTRSFSFGITAYFPPARLTFAYVRRLYRMATTVNQASFFGFPGGSVLFLEATATGDLYSVVPVTFDFHMRPNFKFSPTGPDVLMDPDEDDEAEMFDTYYDPFFPATSATTPYPGNAFSGWATVDYRYAASTDDTAKMILQKPILRLIHQMYFPSDFDKLEL